MPPESANLAYRAAQLLKNEYGVSEGVHLVIEKRIPIAGGMAGGSADAAGALMACSRLWGLKITMAELMQLGARLGADVPFPLMGGCAIGLGRGETLTPTLSRGSFHWVLAFATHQLPTPDVFRRFDEIAETMGQVLPAVPAIPAPLMMALTAGDTHRVASHLVNDLAPAACSLAPQLHATLAAGREAGCLAAMISGSGPTVAFLVEDELTATDLAVNLSSQGIARDVRMVTGPVPGAAIVNR
jgi:4-diphosphocytidyl-2-C-methyl-D-erythritol kinase